VGEAGEARVNGRRGCADRAVEITLFHCLT
jgi:hypothetical protein